MKSSLLLLVFLNVLLGCKNQNDTVLPAQGTVTLDFKIGQERTLVVRGTTPKTFQIKFTDIKESRCSKENCSSCYGGYIYAYFEVQSSSTSDSLVLNRISCINVSMPSFDNPVVDHEDIQNLRIGLATISDQQSKKSNYTAQLLIKEL